jgi:hypothetical protein
MKKLLFSLIFLTACQSTPSHIHTWNTSLRWDEAYTEKRDNYTYYYVKCLWCGEHYPDYFFRINDNETIHVQIK